MFCGLDTIFVTSRWNSINNNKTSSHLWYLILASFSTLWIFTTWSLKKFFINNINVSSIINCNDCHYSVGTSADFVSVLCSRRQPPSQWSLLVTQSLPVCFSHHFIQIKVLIVLFIHLWTEIFGWPEHRLFYGHFLTAFTTNGRYIKVNVINCREFALTLESVRHDEVCLFAAIELGQGEFGSVLKGTWQAPSGEVV